MHQLKPYIGVTGLTAIEEVRGVLSFFDEAHVNLRSDHIPMIGFLVSYKTLNGDRHPTNRRYPPINELRRLLEPARGKAFTTVHYNTNNPRLLASEVIYLFRSGAIYESDLCRAVQLNVPWPPLEELWKIRGLHPDMRITLQLSSKATENLDLVEIVEMTLPYAAFISYILLDPSGGRGEPFDIFKSAKLFRMFRDEGVEAKVGFAGGLSGNNARRVIRSLTEVLETNEFCIDAEGNLRDKLSSNYGDDLLNLLKTREYIHEAAVALRQPLKDRI